jgi:hypothetical protein
MYEHLKTCGYCQKDHKANKLAELGHMIRGTRPITAVNKGASSSSYSYSYSNPRYQRRYKVLSDKQRKLKELGKMIRGL